MKIQSIKIYIDRLKAEDNFSEQGSLSGEILELNSSEIQPSDIDFKLQAYLTDEHLIIQFDATCTVKLPCKICNEQTEFVVKLEKQTHLEPLENLRKGVYDAKEAIRENIVLNIPPFAECQDACPEREYLKQFFKKESKMVESYQPFENL